MRVYSVNRPFDLFTYPKQYSYSNRVDFKRRQYVDEIGREAWGYIDFDDDIPKDELERYELVAVDQDREEREAELRRYAKHVAMRLEQGWTSQAERLFDRAEELGFDAEKLDIAVGEALDELRGATRASR